MPTTKTRTNVTLPEDVDKALNYLSGRDDVSKSTKVVQLIKIGIKLEEDEVWNSLAEARDKKGAKFISHKDTWK